jgi:hypothetical protein
MEENEPSFFVNLTRVTDVQTSWQNERFNLFRVNVLTEMNYLITDLLMKADYTRYNF